ncbi:RHS repeat-associated core domain-containing protein [Agromyces aerolatus]|uniref:RHS repeat-associated core domain-containing protein n=1 Tax=Agromyces sp. LY-1074 TaxID=3074080 RepID=UPI0028587401|nr:MULTISPECIES: RHS repeat-associated core domain-containing protein [unclassified Agromyces]MDR5701503.1 RHS repeat-associated core domain-containing protein [Agromyces sp. LY-1074]MDR5704430.1 RHS repeat-associated core domain-containing protein [Agromyces sp. LY-1358]
MAVLAGPGSVPGAGRVGARVVFGAAGAILSGALIGGLISPSWAGAAESGPGAEPAVLGGFALGDGVEGLVDAASGAFSFALPVAGVSVGWDSRAAAVDRSGLGAGWSVAGLAHVDTEGGVRVSPASGGMFPADATVPSGLSGYLLGDVVFRQRPTEIPARADGRRGNVSAAFELVESGGVRTFFTATGDPVVRMDANGNRSDWEWSGGHRLMRVIDVAGVVTELDWSDPGRVNVLTGAGSKRRATGTVELDGGRVAAVTDASGGRVHVGYTPAGLVGRLAGVSGAATEVSWQGLTDGRAAVDRVRVVDTGTGAELSMREWSAQAGLASGWPMQSAPVAAGAAATGADADGSTTSVSDGVSTVTSEFDGRARLLEREVESAGGSGSVVWQRQAYTYSEIDLGAAIPPQYAHPTGVTVTHLNAVGGQREATETFEFDELGRMTRQVAQDGTVTETTFDGVVGEGELVPVGLPVVQRVTAPDGLVAETRHELNANRTAHVVTETFSGRVGDADLMRTGRAEFDVAADGFVTAERTFPQGGAGTPIVTRHEKGVDLVAGTVTTSTTAAAGTDSAATATQVTDLLHGVVLQETGPTGAAASAAYDGLGRPIELTNPDGEVATSYDYTDYGTTTTRTHPDHQPPASPGVLVGDAHRNPFQYAGEYTNPTGTQHLQIRTYDPATMRLTSTDPEPQHNRYHYAALNPITLADPTGRIPALPKWVGFAIAGVGLLAAAIGLGLAAGGLATVAATAIGGAPLTAKLALSASIVLAGGFDLAASGVALAHEIDPKFLDHEVAFGLSVASAGVGGITLFAGFFTRSIARIDVNKLRWLGATEEQAEAIRFAEELVGIKAQAALGQLQKGRFETHALVLDLHRTVGMAASTGGWSAEKHLAILDELLRGPQLTSGAKRLRFFVTTEASTLRDLSNAEFYARYLRGADVTHAIDQVRVELRPGLRELEFEALKGVVTKTQTAAGATTTRAYPFKNLEISPGSYYGMAYEFRGPDGGVIYIDHCRALDKPWSPAHAFGPEHGSPAV